MVKKSKSRKPKFIINNINDTKKRRLSDIVKEGGLESSGKQFKDLTSSFSKEGIETDVEIDKISLNSFRPVTERGLDIVEASLLYHSSSKSLKDGVLKSSLTRVFLCIHPDSNSMEIDDENTKFIVCDGNHRVSFWKKMKWKSIPAIVYPFKLTNEKVEMFAQNQNQLQEMWNSQKNCLQLLGRLVRLISNNDSMTSTRAFAKNKGLFYSIDMCRKYFTIAKIICDRGLAHEFEKIEKENTTDSLKLSMLVPSKLNSLNNNQIVFILKFSCNSGSKTSKF